MMKTLLRQFLTCLLFVPAALSAASFEGNVSFKMTSGKGKPQEITYSIKGDKMRMAMPGVQGSGGMIMDMKKKEALMLMDDQKAYMVMALPVDTVAKQNEDVNLEKTDETEKILGYTATKYIVTSKEGTTDVWLAEGLGTFMSFSNSPMGGKRGAPPQAWERALAGKELFPMRVVGREGGGNSGKGKGESKGKGNGGKETFRMEVTAIEKTPLPDSLFNPPAGYQKFDMGGMMKGMIPGAR
jgi:hypothetical protein